ncbi:NAD(P)-binding domain-containing protein [Ectothiorhodospiraceae bacterium WFHF3C12]|nr:NAD(P)-binding domain-containing protein [Ectothiorhodospiraceae bacterium WFHF3C12]
MPTGTHYDLIIVGGGIGGVISLKYARDAGLRALLLEGGDSIGGLWRDLPEWQDIQFRKEDWTLGDIPIQGEDQRSILQNIRAWVDRYGLAPDIRLNARVTAARPASDGWWVSTGSEEYTSTYLIAATGGHNRPVIPDVERDGSRIAEYHSSQLRDPAEIAGRRVVVVGGGASAYDLLDLCFAHGAEEVTWVHRSLKWMRPTRKLKYFGTDMRLLAKFQMLGLPTRTLNRILNRDLHARYEKAGLTDILPGHDFDVQHDQLIPGRPGMIRNFSGITRYRDEVQSLSGNTVQLASGERLEADLLLWGTGYRYDLDYLGLEPVNNAGSLAALNGRCYSVFRSVDAPNLFLLAPGVLEGITSAPWAYAHAAKSIMSHILGPPVFNAPPKNAFTNHFDLAKHLARRDRRSYPFGLWYLKYLRLALFYPKDRPMPLP